LKKDFTFWVLIELTKFKVISLQHLDNTISLKSKRNMNTIKYADYNHQLSKINHNYIALKKDKFTNCPFSVGDCIYDFSNEKFYVIDTFALNKTVLSLGVYPLKKINLDLYSSMLEMSVVKGSMILIDHRKKSIIKVESFKFKEDQSYYNILLNNYKYENTFPQKTKFEIFRAFEYDNIQDSNFETPGSAQHVNNLKQNNDNSETPYKTNKKN
jgi:hypothetical protein